jgi:hypothetical protein
MHHDWKNWLQSSSVTILRGTTLFRQPEENILITWLLTSSTTASTVACQVWGLIDVHSCKLSATLGGSTSTRPGVRKIVLKSQDLQFCWHQQHGDPTVLGGSTKTLSPIVVVILRQQLDYVIIDYAAPTTRHPTKAKFSSSKNRLSFNFRCTRHSGAPPWKIILHTIDFEKLWKP